MLGLGVTPIGLAESPTWYPHLADQLRDVEDLSTENGLDLERAIELDPDLILMLGGSASDAWNRENYDRYSAILPTFAYEFAFTYIEEIYGMTRKVAQALGRTEQAEAQIAAYEARVTELRQRVAAAGLNDRPVSSIQVFPNEIWVVFARSEGIAFRALGIAQPEGQQDPGQSSFAASLEELRILNAADTVFVQVVDTDNPPLEVMESPVWQGLEPVRNGRAHLVDTAYWNGADIASLMLILDDIERYFIAPAE